MRVKAVSNSNLLKEVVEQCCPDPRNYTPAVVADIAITTLKESVIEEPRITQLLFANARFAWLGLPGGGRRAGISSLTSRGWVPKFIEFLMKGRSSHTVSQVIVLDELLIAVF